MNARIFKPQTIEALNVLWRSLPLRGVTDQEGTLEDYCFALSDFDSDAIWNTVNALRSGKIDEASKNFCPRAPELAIYVRNEQKRLDLLREHARSLPAPASRHEFRDWRIFHRQRTEALAQEGFRLVREKISLDECVTLGRRKLLPAGTIWFWSLQECWAPGNAGGNNG